MDEDKFKLKKVDELVALRTSIIYVLIVLVGGTIGLSLNVNSLFKVILICLGIFYTCVLISNLGDIASKIDKILSVRKDIK